MTDKAVKLSETGRAMLMLGATREEPTDPAIHPARCRCPAGRAIAAECRDDTGGLSPGGHCGVFLA